MSAKEFYNKKAFKHQLQRAIKHDHRYFKDCIIEIMEQYTEKQINLSLGNVINQREFLIGQNLFSILSEMCDFTALDSEMQDVIEAIKKDNPQPSKLPDPQKWFMEKYDVRAERMDLIEHKGNNIVEFIYAYLNDLK